MDRQFADELTSIRKDESGEIRLGIAQWRGAVLLPQIMPAFQKLYPHVNIEVLEGRAVQVETALIQGKVDLCLMNLPSRFPAQTVQEVIWNERVLLVGNRNHPVVRQALLADPNPDGYRSIDIRFLENEHFISLKPGQNMTAAAEQLFASYNLRPKSVWSTENMTTALNMVSKTMSFTMMPEAGARFSPLPDDLAVFTIEHAKQLFAFAAIYRQDFVLNNWIHTLLDLTRQIYTDTSVP